MRSVTLLSMAMLALSTARAEHIEKGDVFYSTQKEVETITVSAFEANEKVTIVVQAKGEKKDLAKAFGNIPNMPNMVQMVKPKPVTFKYKYDDAPGLYRGDLVAPRYGSIEEKDYPRMYLYFPAGEAWILEFFKRWDAAKNAWIIKPDEVNVLGKDPGEVGNIETDKARDAALAAINAGISQRDDDRLAKVSARDLPEPEMTNAELERRMYKAAKKFQKGRKFEEMLLKKVMILEEDWTIWNHTKTGVVTGRSKEGAVFYTADDDGFCYVGFFNFRQSWAGKDFNKSFVALPGKDGYRITCDKIKNLK